MKVRSLTRWAAVGAFALVASAATAETTVFTFGIDESQEVPPTGSPATGTGICTFDSETNLMTWHIEFSGLLGNETAAHIHNAPAGQNGGVAINVGTGSPKTGSQTLTSKQAAELLAGNFYVNIHSSMFGGGEIRGQIVGASSTRLSEIRRDQPSTDNDEYVELEGAANAALDGLTFIVIGDTGSETGIIEEVVDLAGQSLDANGRFVAAEASFTLGTADLTTTLNFENNDNVTYMLVSGFNGANGADLDTDDDGILDVTPWKAIVDSVSFVGDNTPCVDADCVYGAVIVGPDGTFHPAHAYRCDADGDWTIGAFDPEGGDDTPGAVNGACEGDDCAGDIDGSGDVGAPDLLSFLAAWGTNNAFWDFDESGLVAAPDLLTLLSLWGPCP